MNRNLNEMNDVRITAELKYRFQPLDEHGRRCVVENAVNTYYRQKPERKPGGFGTGRNLLHAAGVLQRGDLLGLQFSADPEGYGEIFLAGETEAETEDLDWILGNNADAVPVEETKLSAFGENGRRIYRAFGPAVCGPDTKNADPEELLAELSDEGAVFRIIAWAEPTNGKGQGAFLFSLPAALPFRTQAHFRKCFPGIRLMEASAEQAGFSADPLSEEVFTMLLDSMMYTRAMKYTADEMEREDREKAEERKRRFEEEGRDLDIDELGLTVRTYNCLRRNGITKVNELLRLSLTEIQQFRNIGKKGIHEIQEKLRELEAEKDLEKMKGKVTEVHTLADFHKSDDEEFDEDDFDVDECDAEEADEEEGVQETRVVLSDMVGLGAVKKRVNELTCYARMKKAMEDSGRDLEPISLNTVFAGNPGTAKTTVARILAGIYHDLGILQSPRVMEVGRSQIVGKYIGHTAAQVRELFKKAKGKLLFIDEAYSLVDDKEKSFGDEAINTIVQEMENHRRETVVIFAGYPDKMKEFLDRNPGLRSRVPFEIDFQDYSAEEIAEIAELEAKKRGFTMSPEAKEKAVALCEAAVGRPECGNGRFGRNLAERGILRYASRVFAQEEAPENADYMLTADDLELPEQTEKVKAVTVPLGFCG